MLTSRSWWFFFFVATGLALSVLVSHHLLILVHLTLLLWFLSVWLLFIWRLRFVVPAIHVERRVSDERGPINSLWAGRSATIHVTIRLLGSGELPFVRFSERIPFGTSLLQGTLEVNGGLHAAKPLELSYQIQAEHPGRIRFEGVSMQVADLQGFFFHSGFLSDQTEVRVLPPLADIRGHAPTVKRHNLLPSPGQHRHLRPGTGSELLDLRDYLPGDPPKTIAWKVSARRDKLITKEYESEVPVRCTLFVDASQSVRVGPPGRNALARLTELAGAACQAIAGSRDLVGLCLFDDQQVFQTVAPARTPRHVVRLVNLLTDAAGLAPATGAARPSKLMPLAYALAEEVYPYLLTPAVNGVPAWLPWIVPVPTHVQEHRPAFSKLVRGLYLVLTLLPLLLIAITAAPLAWDLYDSLPLTEPFRTGVTLLLVTGPFAGYLLLARFLYRALPLLLSRRRRRQTVLRKRLAALLSVRYGLAPGGLGLLLEDDQQFSLLLQRFLADHHVPYPLPLYDYRGRYLFAAPHKVEVLAKALLRAIGRGRDNELFVLMADLLELTDALDPLLRAIKVARARHHQVLVICPWPPGVPMPNPSSNSPLVSLSQGSMPAVLDLHQSDAVRYGQAFAELRRTFARIGISVLCTCDTDPMRLVLDRLNRLRSAARRK